MHEQPRRPNNAKLERAIVLELLAAAEENGRTIAELAAAIGGSGTEVDEVVEGLREAGTIERTGQRVRVSPAVLRLDALGLIGI